MKKKTISLLFALVFLALCLAPSLGFALGHGSGAAANQVLAAKPRLLDREGRFNPDCLQELARYVDDRFALRQEAVTLWAALNAQLLRSSVTEDVLYGRDGWLYFRPTLPDYTRTQPMTQRELWCAARRLALLREYAEAQGGRFLFAIAPNKNSLYPGHMPALPREALPSNAEALAPLLAKEGVPYVDLFALFGAQDEELYYPRDTHWNRRGAALAADAILEALGRESAYFSGPFAADSHRGDLCEMLFPAGTQSDPDFRYEPGFTFTASSENADSITLTTACENGEGSLLLYRDSFGRALYPYLAESFGEALISRKSGYDPTALAPGGCLVIELVERNLPKLLTEPLTVPAAERDRSLLSNRFEGLGVSKLVLAKDGPEGYTVLCGDLGGIRPEDDSPVYVLAGLKLFEALPGAEDFRLCLPDEVLSDGILVLFRADGDWVCLEGQTEG